MFKCVVKLIVNSESVYIRYFIMLKYKDFDNLLIMQSKHELICRLKRRFS